MYIHDCVCSFQNRHKEIHEEYRSAIKKDTNNQSSMTAFVTSSGSSKKYDDRHPKQKELTNAITMYIAGDLCPLSTVESKNFRRVLEIADPAYKMPSRKTLSNKHLKQQFHAIDLQLRQQLQQAHDICLTIDLWSSRQMRGYLGVTVHYLRDWTLQTAVLTCKRVRGSHSGENIHELYEELVAGYDVTSKVSYVVTDNASNMKRAFSLPGYSIKRPKDDEDYYYCGHSEDEIEEQEESNGYDHFPQHTSCFNHTLNLCVTDGLKAAGTLRSTIGTASKVVSHVRKSLLASEKLEDERRLQTPCPTRWNSQLYMIKSILAVPEEKLREACPNTQLSKHERNILEDLVQILKPFKLATKKTQQDCYVSFSIVIPCVRGQIHQKW